MIEEKNSNSSLDNELDEVNKQNEGGFVDENPIDSNPETDKKDEETATDDDKKEDETTEGSEVDTVVEDDKKDEEDAEDDDKKDDDDDDDDKKDEDEDKDTDDDKKDEDEDEDDDDVDDDKKDDDKTKKPNRPEKYVPIPKYQKTKKDLKDANDTIADLKSQLEGKEEGSVEEDEELKEWAEKNNMSVEASQGLLKIARKGMVSQKDFEKIATIQKDNEVQAEVNHFDKEYKDINSTLSKEFPKASDDSKKQAKDLMDKLAHTRKYHNTELGYVLFKEKAQFDKILKTTPSRKGMEGEQDKRPTGGPKGFDPATIQKKDGKYDFSAIEAIEDPSEKMQAIEALPADPYVEYVNQMDDSALEINRDGRKIELS